MVFTRIASRLPAARRSDSAADTAEGAKSIATVAPIRGHCRTVNTVIIIRVVLTRAANTIRSGDERAAAKSSSLIIRFVVGAPLFVIINSEMAADAAASNRRVGARSSLAGRHESIVGVELKRRGAVRQGGGIMGRWARMR